MTRRGERPGRRTVVVTVVAGLIGAVLIAFVAVPALDERRSAAYREAVVDDAHALRSALLELAYPGGAATVTLAQDGSTVSILKRGTVVGTVELSDPETRVVDWTPAPFNAGGWPFVFCIEHDDREWAMYHSSDGVVRETGTDGECAVPDIAGVNARYPCPRPTLMVSERPGGVTRVSVRWGRPNRNADLTRTVDVYDGARLVRQLYPWAERATLTTFPTSEGRRADLTFVAANGRSEFDSLDCPVTPLDVPPVT